MKITKKQLHSIIEQVVGYSPTKTQDDIVSSGMVGSEVDPNSTEDQEAKDTSIRQLTQTRQKQLDDDETVDAEATGQQLQNITSENQMKISRKQLRRIIREAFTTLSDAEFDKASMDDYGSGNASADRPWGTYAEKSTENYSDTITMSPNGDSLLVDGKETYTQDVPSQLQIASGIKMDAGTSRALVDELRDQEAGGYVELGIKYNNGKWSW